MPVKYYSKYFASRSTFILPETLEEYTITIPLYRGT